MWWWKSSKQNGTQSLRGEKAPRHTNANCSPERSRYCKEIVGSFWVQAVLHLGNIMRSTIAHTHASVGAFRTANRFWREQNIKLQLHAGVACSLFIVSTLYTAFGFGSFFFLLVGKEKFSVSIFIFFAVGVVYFLTALSSICKFIA